jgi:pimeloyl-ACP methyl ester carboxylesterase/DNA-binding CsgD family transcriptional regulator
MSTVRRDIRPNQEMHLRQQVRFVKATDGIRLAWAESGSGPTLVKAANWLTHLEYEWHSPVWKHWIRFFSEHSRFIRYDERGCGMSDVQLGTLTLEQWTQDLASIIDAAQSAEPVTLLGISQGAAACIRFAVEHPERVARLILYGGYAHGPFKRGTPGPESTYRAMIELTRTAWAKDNPTFRQVFTSRFIPGGSAEQLQWFNDLCLKTTVGESAARLFEARGNIDIEDLLPLVRTPTLVLHARGDEVVPLSEGQLLASQIEGAEFVELDSRNHVLLEHEPAWERFKEAVLAFMPVFQLPANHAKFAALSLRERQVLAQIARGLSNDEIATLMHISEKTVRNHASNVFDKLGVWSRTQAMVLARDHGFTG